MPLFYDLRSEDRNRDRVTISDGRGMSACILTYGAAVQSLNVPDARGDVPDVVLGYGSPAVYDMQDGYLGAIVGRVAGRIRDACYFVNGRRIDLDPNQTYGVLHGGPVSFSYKTWEIVSRNSFSVLLRLISPDGDQGFPGNVVTEVLYTMEVPGELTIRYRAEADRDTPLNLTNHMYFNLDGHESGPVDGHKLMLNARKYLPTDENLVPTGKIEPVAGTLLDLGSLTTLGPLLHAPELEATGGLDHCFVLARSAEGGAEAAAVLKGEKSGITMSVYTDQPAVQVYTAGGLSPRTGKSNVMYGPQHAVCLETQGFPDAVHHINFPSVMLRAGERFESFTTYRFTQDEG